MGNETERNTRKLDAHAAAPDGPMKGTAATKGICGFSVLLLAMIAPAAAREQPPYSLAAIEAGAGSNSTNSSSVFAIEAKQIALQKQCRDSYMSMVHEVLDKKEFDCASLNSSVSDDTTAKNVNKAKAGTSAQGSPAKTEKGDAGTPTGTVKAIARSAIFLETFLDASEIWFPEIAGVTDKENPYLGEESGPNMTLADCINQTTEYLAAGFNAPDMGDSLDEFAKMLSAVCTENSGIPGSEGWTLGSSNSKSSLVEQAVRGIVLPHHKTMKEQLAEQPELNEEQQRQKKRFKENRRHSQKHVANRHYHEKLLSSLTKRELPDSTAKPLQEHQLKMKARVHELFLHLTDTGMQANEAAGQAIRQARAEVVEHQVSADHEHPEHHAHPFVFEGSQSHDTNHHDELHPYIADYHPVRPTEQLFERPKGQHGTSHIEF